MIRDFGLLILMLFVSFVGCGYGDVCLQCGLFWLVGVAIWVCEFVHSGFLDRLVLAGV